jgi:competence protein ComEA
VDDDEAAVRERARDSLARMARRAYQAAHGEPVSSPPRGVRWRVEPKAALSLALALALVVALVWWSARPLDARATDQESVAFASVSTLPVVIDVAGAVASPGVMELPAGARVRDAIAAAGGFLVGADRSSINLARPLVDGEQVYVPAAGEDRADAVNVNSADAGALEALPGIGPVLAERIVADRAANGPFVTIEDLGRVSGIGPSLVARLAGLATA